MATPGCDPYQELFHLFHQESHNNFDRKLTKEQRDFISTIIGWVHEERMHDPSTSYVGRFMVRMKEAGYELDRFNADIVQGLLECLNPYQKGSPYTDPRTVARDIGCVFDHFKGGIYLVRGLSHWASGNDGEIVVEYLSMIFGTKHSRLLDEWCEVVKWPDGKYRSRFVFRGPDLNTPEPPFKVLSPKVPPV